MISTLQLELSHDQEVTSMCTMVLKGGEGRGESSTTYTGSDAMPAN